MGYPEQTLYLLAKGKRIKKGRMRIVGTPRQAPSSLANGIGHPDGVARRLHSVLRRHAKGSPELGLEKPVPFDHPGIRHTITHAIHDSCAVLVGCDSGKGHGRGCSQAPLPVQSVQAGGNYPDTHLSTPRFRLGHFTNLHHFRGAVLFKPDYFHGGIYLALIRYSCY